jgi:hypothetical protein
LFPEVHATILEQLQFAVHHGHVPTLQLYHIRTIHANNNKRKTLDHLRLLPLELPGIMHRQFFATCSGSKVNQCLRGRRDNSKRSALKLLNRIAARQHLIESEAEARRMDKICKSALHERFADREFLLGAHGLPPIAVAIGAERAWPDLPLVGPGRE